MFLIAGLFAHLKIPDYIRINRISKGQGMFTTFSDNSVFIMPVCYHPTTTLLLDDDADFVNHLNLQLNKSQIETIAFTDPIEALREIHESQYPLQRRGFFLKTSGKTQLDWHAIHQEIYNTLRFSEIMTSVIDYDMPDKTGFDFMSELHNPIGIPFHSYILLTGTPPSAFAKDFADSRVAKELISKYDSDYFTQLLTAIKNKNVANSQWFSYDIARALSLDPAEKTSFLFEGNFLPILNQYIQDNQICELYLYDKQGSLLFLDNEANLSWLFVRNDLGIENTIRFATEFDAPKSVIDALKSKEKILSLYRPGSGSFHSRKPIEWDNYLLPANLLPANGHYTQFFNLEPTNHYYAFTKEFPGHNIKRDEILPYKRILEEQMRNQYENNV